MRRLLFLLALAACGTDETSSDDDPADDCSACSDDAFCLVRAEGEIDEWTESCEPIPDACELPLSCDCAAELYDLCPNPNDVVSWACSDTFPPVAVTCGY